MLANHSLIASPVIRVLMPRSPPKTKAIAVLRARHFSRESTLLRLNTRSAELLSGGYLPDDPDAPTFTTYASLPGFEGGIPGNSAREAAAAETERELIPYRRTPLLLIIRP